MKKVFAAIVLMSAVIPAFAATAYFTGRQEYVRTVTYQTALNCEYNYLGQKFWQLHSGSCPYSVEIQ